MNKAISMVVKAVILSVAAAGWMCVGISVIKFLM